MAVRDTTDSASADGSVAVRRWGLGGISCFLLCVVGLGVSAYLTAEHAAGGQLACPRTSTFNCQAVTTDPRWSVVFGVPVAVYGLIFFAVQLLLCSSPAWRSQLPWLPWLRLGLAVIGTLMVFYLIGVELFAVNAICLWCTGVHALTVALLLVLLSGEERQPLRQVFSRG